MKVNPTLPRLVIFVALDLILSLVIIVVWLGVAFFGYWGSQSSFGFDPASLCAPARILIDWVLEGFPNPYSLGSSDPFFGWLFVILRMNFAIVPTLTTFTTPIWIGLYVFSAIFARPISGVQIFENLAIRFLDVETIPIRTIGFIASFLTFSGVLLLHLVFWALTGDSPPSQTSQAHLKSVLTFNSRPYPSPLNGTLNRQTIHKPL